MAGRKHLTFEQRKKIEAMHAGGTRPQTIAEEIGVSLSTIYNELRRGSVDGIYSARESQLRYQKHLGEKGPEPLVLKNEKLRTWIRAKSLHEGMTPKEMEEELRRLNDPELGVVSHQTIYSAILQG